MRLRLVREPFDNPDFIFELKHDGFRALAYIENGSFERPVGRRGIGVTFLANPNLTTTYGTNYSSCARK